MQSISREEVRRLLETQQIILIEILPPEHFERAHLPGALNIPYERIATLAPALIPDKKSLVVVYGLNFTWKTAQQAVRELVALGYTNVREYEEGKQDWVAAGLPLEGTKLDDPISKARPSELVGHMTPAQQSILQQSSKASGAGGD
jgi:rhodanese-related sulfurtransferase